MQIKSPSSEQSSNENFAFRVDVELRAMNQPHSETVGLDRTGPDRAGADQPSPASDHEFPPREDATFFIF